MKIWILGSGGQLGCALIDCCAREQISFLASNHSEMDITNLEMLMRKGEKSNCTHIINCAAYTDVDGAEKNRQRAFDVNAFGPENLGIVAKENGMKIVHVSTDYVFDGEKQTPYLETDAPNPLGIYGTSKWEGEQRLLEQMRLACIVRSSWIFGPLGKKNFISNLFSKLQVEPHVHAVEDQITRATYYRDLAQALLDLCCHSGIFHFANGSPLSRYQIALDFCREAKERNLPIKCEKISPISSKEFPTISPRPNYSVLSTEKVSTVLGRKPRLWETILKEYFDHVQALH